MRFLLDKALAETSSANSSSVFKVESSLAFPIMPSLRFSYSYIASVISGTMGTKIPETEKPRQESPMYIMKSFYGSLKTYDGPTKNKLNASKKVQPKITFYLSIIEQSQPNTGEPSAKNKPINPNTKPTLASLTPMLSSWIESVGSIKKKQRTLNVIVIIEISDLRFEKKAPYDTSNLSVF